MGHVGEYVMFSQFNNIILNSIAMYFLELFRIKNVCCSNFIIIEM